jgi:hypothetical protein
MCHCFEANKKFKNIYGESLVRSFADNQFLPVTSSQNPPYDENNFNVQYLTLYMIYPCTENDILGVGWWGGGGG